MTAIEPSLLAMVAIYAGVTGLAVGSFLNVVIHRVPRDESLVRPASRCPGCGAGIALRDNVPVLSWILLRGRCRSCGRPIAARYPVIEALTGVAWVAVALRFGATAELPAFLLLFASLIAVSAIDIELRIIPKKIVWVTFGLSAAVLGVAATARGERTDLVRALLGALAAFTVFRVIHLVSPRGMGYGDVRLAALLGLHLGWLSWAHVYLGPFLGFLLGSVGGIAMIALGRRGRKDLIPFGPYLAIGTAIAVLWGSWLLERYPVA